MVEQVNQGLLAVEQFRTAVFSALGKQVLRGGIHYADAADPAAAALIAHACNSNELGAKRSAVLKIAQVAHVIGWQAGVGGMETAGAIVSYLAQHQDQIEPFFAGEASPIDWPDFTNGGCLSWHASEGGKLIFPGDVPARGAAAAHHDQSDPRGGVSPAAPQATRHTTPDARPTAPAAASS